MYVNSVLSSKFSVSNEDITSQDLEVLMKVRASTKVKVIISYKLVRYTLVTIKDSNLILDDINGAEVEEKHSQIRRKYNNFLKIHKSYILHRLPQEDPR